MLSVVIRMAFYCIVFQRFGRRGWPSSGNLYYFSTNFERLFFSISHDVNIPHEMIILFQVYMVRKYYICVLKETPMLEHTNVPVQVFRL